MTNQAARANALPWRHLVPAALLAAGLPVLAQVDIADKPLFVTAGVEPNIISAIDDSGSMDSEVLLPNNDGALWWHTGNDSFVGLDQDDNADASGVLNYNRAGGASSTWKKFVYLFPNGTGTGNRVYSDSSNDHYAAAPFPQFAFLRSAAYNGMYYDYRVDYTPWPDEGGRSYSNVSPTAAPSDAESGGNTLDLTTERRTTANQHKFRLYPGMVIPEDTVRNNGSWITQGADTLVTSTYSEEIEYFPATYWVVDESNTSYELEDDTGAEIGGSCDAPDPTHYPYFEDRPSELSGIDALAYDGRCLRRIEIRDDGRTFPSGRSYAEEIQNFANWFSYYRKRHLATRAGISKAFSRLVSMRVGALTNNSRNLRGMYSLAVPSERESFFDFIYERDGNSGGTPNRETLDYIGDQFHGNSGVITESCQQNFALLFTDGFSNVNTGSGVGNADGAMGAPFEDTYSNTIADIAAHFYNIDLRGAAFDKGMVPVETVCATPTPPLTTDCRDDLHMVTYGITLGAVGKIFGITHETLEDAHDNPPAWENPTATRNPVQVDDLYHAAVNSRGAMLNAQNAQELEEALSAALLDITERTRTSATASSTSTAVLQEETKLFSVAFRSDDWSGDLIAQSLDPVDGSVTDLAWSASDQLAANATSSRVLLTHDGSSGVPLALADLSGTQQAALNTAPDGTVDGLGSDRLSWMRGNAVAGLRSRDSGDGQRLLGDIVSSTPIYVEPNNRGYSLLPSGFFPEDYNDFLTDIADRAEFLAVGANDGMLHVFDVDSGDELFGYVPAELLEPQGSDPYSAISELADPGYSHRFLVDGTPAIGDILVSNDWTTVLIGSMGVGGRTVFAIDVTDPESVTASDVLWEFTDADLGYGATEVQIVPLNNGKFAAVFGNGYNSDNHRAVLFVLDAEDGSLLAKISTGVGSSSTPNGLAPVQATDWPDSSQLAQYVYGGDLLGNVWRFDLTDTTPGNWSVDRIFTATDASGNAQPITSGPRLSPAPNQNGELMVVFGTGSFFRDGDQYLSNPQVQTMYGIRDSLSNTTAAARSDLLVQEIIYEDTVEALGSSRLVRAVSSNLYSSPTPERGWRLDLSYNSSATGERVIARATFPSGLPRQRVRFTTLTPDDDPCATGREGFIFDLDLLTGGATAYSVFDINDDGVFNVGDYIGNYLISGVGGGQGERLTTVRDKEGTGDYFYDGAGDRIGDTDGAEGLASGDPLGRQSWLQLR